MNENKWKMISQNCSGITLRRDDKLTVHMQYGRKDNIRIDAEVPFMMDNGREWGVNFTSVNVPVVDVLSMAWWNLEEDTIDYRQFSSELGYFLDNNDIPRNFDNPSNLNIRSKDVEHKEIPVSNNLWSGDETTYTDDMKWKYLQRSENGISLRSRGKTTIHLKARGNDIHITVCCPYEDNSNGKEIDVDFFTVDIPIMDILNVIWDNNICRNMKETDRFLNALAVFLDANNMPKSNQNEPRWLRKIEQVVFCD